MWLRRQLQQMITTWEPAARISLLLAMTVFLSMSGLLWLGSERFQQPALVGLVTSLLFMQGLVLWANRRMVTPLTAARRHYLRGDFHQVIRLLASEVTSENPDADALTLVGNTYRQMGNLEESEKVLFKAVNISPEAYFPVYGFGRTALMKGDYDTAKQYLSRAIELNAPPATCVDLAEIHYRLGEIEQMKRMLEVAPSDLDAPRQLMRMFLSEGNYRVTEDQEAALAYWEEMAKRFSHTAYGVALERDTKVMRQMTKGAM